MAPSLRKKFFSFLEDRQKELGLLQLPTNEKMNVAVRVTHIPSDKNNIVWEFRNSRYCRVRILTNSGFNEVTMSNENCNPCPSFKNSLLSKVGMRLIVTDAILKHHEDYKFGLPEVEIKLSASSTIFRC